MSRIRLTVPRLKLLAKIHRGQVPTKEEAATLRSVFRAIGQPEEERHVA